jgi:hypothetical protein
VGIGKEDWVVEIQLFFLRRMQKNMQVWVKYKVILKRRNKNENNCCKITDK